MEVAEAVGAAEVAKKKLCDIAIFRKAIIKQFFFTNAIYIIECINERYKTLSKVNIIIA